VLLTNAAGGINLEFSSGALMLIRDHINYSGQNPLIGPNLEDFGPRFPDMTDLYTKQLRETLKSVTQKEGIHLEEGVYAMYSGPSYETPAEIHMLRGFGADAVGMSTVPEAIAARHSGMRVIGISCITNMAAGVLDQPLSHEEVVETALRVKDTFILVVSLAVQHFA
jgi:purine-nucleoside phosphorylase